MKDVAEGNFDLGLYLSIPLPGLISRLGFSNISL